MHDSIPKILIHEYITGGGWKEAELPQGLASEGFLMLSAILEDFMKWGRFTVCTTLDKSLAQASITADSITIIDPSEHEKTLAGLAKECDFAIIIAPESNGILADLNGLLRDLEYKIKRLITSITGKIYHKSSFWRILMGNIFLLKRQYIDTIQIYEHAIL